MSAILFDIFIRTEGSKPEYICTGFENKFAEEQRAGGKEPWVDCNFTKLVNGNRVKAAKIVYEDGSETNLKGRWPKLGFRQGFTLLNEDDLEVVEEEAPAEEGETEATPDDLETESL